MATTYPPFPAHLAFGSAPSTPAERTQTADVRRRERAAWIVTVAGCCMLLAGMAYAAPYLPGADTVPHSAGCRVETARLCR